jgi:lipopolysaccharide/colanic/teichoic acid biosynthesis glycosyltransferase
MAALALASAAAAWLLPLTAKAWPTRLAVLLLISLAHAILAFSIIQWGGRSDGKGPAWVYRLGFAVSTVTGLARAGTLLSNPGTSIALLLAAVLGSFVGALEATHRDTALWEDNFPPPEALADRVRARHEARLGPLPKPPWAKRAFDLALAAVGGALALPLLFLILLAIWLEDPGPLFFVKNSVGRGGRSFRQWKIRTMVRSAEAETGPVLASESDERVLSTGRWLRKTALDELPQILNILQGSMSFVGPRPQRTVLVDAYLDRLPEYADRHAVAPGIAGLAQVAGHYYLTPRQKLRYDRLYVAHAGLGFDLKLVAIAFATVFWLRWRPGWNGRLPRSWLHAKRGTTQAALAVSAPPT